MKQTRILFLSLSVSMLFVLAACTPSSTAPQANDDEITAIEGVLEIIEVLSNDSDDGTLVASSVEITEAPANGTATVTADGEISYTSNAGFVGSDELKYTVTDDEDNTSNEATVMITVVEDAFGFAAVPAEDYTRVDRMGMPAIATAVITSKNEYNAADPVDDADIANNPFVVEIVTNVAGLHNALDDDLNGLGLTPCTVDGADPLNPDTSSCITQAAPLVIPDTLKLDTTAAAGFPNGRLLADPVIDVTLAVVLLDLGVEGQTAVSLVGALNPAANDKAFQEAFPYVAAPH